MAATNYDRVGKALELLRQGLLPFVDREMKAALGLDWTNQALHSTRPDDDRGGGEPHLDIHALLLIMWDNWNSVFRNTLGHAERSMVSELREVRNRWAHQQSFSTDDAYRALDSAARLLTGVSAPEAREVEHEKQELLRVRFEEQARRERRKAAVAPVEGKPTAGLRPWREIITPHPDVASGRYQQAEFAADLAAVYYGDIDADSEYNDPREFFQRTFITEGLRHLLKNALLRLSDQGGDPVVELQTNFGGGKTHSMLALYHLFSDTPVSEMPGVESLLNELGMTARPGETPGQPQSGVVKRVVLVGTALSPGQSHREPDGTVVHTMWGELAWQLGRAEGFAMVAEADVQGVSPGSNVLRDLFARYSPCLILIDEWVAFVRQLYRKHGLPAGSFDANMSFAQALTEAAKPMPGTLVVASLPASDIEIGGEGGKEALARLKNTFGRIESAWRPASAEEGFEIVRRRLFQPIGDPRNFTARDAVVGAFARLYREQTQEFPSDCRDGDFERRMKAAYPIHPELFDRLYTDWSSLEKFQRTRGVLRLMAAVIHTLWERNDGGLLIMPASVPIDAPPVQFELTRYVEDNWIPIIERDVDGSNSLPLALDRGNPNLGRYSACRRVARTIYMGSAPTAKANNPGLDERRIKLGCVQPGESVATFGDALRRLTDNATHLYVDRNRYWFNTQPSVTRLAQDRAAQADEDVIWEELKRRLRADRKRGELAAVHASPQSSADVPDEMRARLVILGPEYPHSGRSDSSAALQATEQILSWRGNSPRLHQNMLAFLAPDRKRLDDLELAIRHHLAWGSIHDERDILNLDTFQRNQARTKYEQANETVDARIKETYIWLLVPYQSDPQNPDTLEFQESRLQGRDSLAVQASRKLKNEEWLITQFGAIRLRMALDSYNLWQGADHTGLKQLWEYFARYPYLPRLQDHDVLLGAVQDGIGQLTWRENFAYAEAWDEEQQRYLGLKAGQTGSVIMDSHSLLVRPQAAQRQLERERELYKPPLVKPGGDQPVPGEEPGTGRGEGGAPPVDELPVKKKLRRFYGTVELDTVRMTSEAGNIADSIIQHLSSLVGADVTVTVEIQANLPDGAPDHVVRTVTENARTLKFKQFGFEEE